MNLCLFASGSGSNVEAIVREIHTGRLSARPVLILSDKAEARVLERANKYQIPTVTLNPSDFENQSDYTTALLAVLEKHGVDFIGLAGYLKKVPVAVVTRYKGRMINIHPALLPAFGGPGMYGMHVHRAVIQHGARWTGVTIHFVDNDYDTGPIIIQKPVPVHQDDTPELLAQRVLAVEHILYPEALRLFTEGRVHLDGHRVHIDPMIPNI